MQETFIRAQVSAYLRIYVAMYLWLLLLRVCRVAAI